MWEGPPSHSESFLHFDVVNGAIWCICPVFSTYSTNLYLILLWKWLKGGSFTCIHATLFSFFLSLSLPVFCVAFLGGRPPPPRPPPPRGYAPALHLPLFSAAAALCHVCDAANSRPVHSFRCCLPSFVEFSKSNK